MFVSIFRKSDIQTLQTRQVCRHTLFVLDNDKTDTYLISKHLNGAQMIPAAQRRFA